MRRTLPIMISLYLFLAAALTHAEGPVPTTNLQDQINLKFRNYFGPDSQALLPFNKMETPDWKKFSASKTLKRIYTEADKFYNSKVYTLTLYQAEEDGSYYLDAKGGFWGMDELVYGPISAQELQ
jgi:hypothetical protein